MNGLHLRDMATYPTESEVINLSLTPQMWERIESAHANLNNTVEWIIEELCWETQNKGYMPSRMRKAPGEKVSREIQIDKRVFTTIKGISEHPDLNWTTSDVIQYLCEKYLDEFVTAELARRGI